MFTLSPGLSALSALELSTDGPIPSAAYAHARKLDAARRALNPPAARIRIGRITLNKHTAIDLMAQEIIKGAEAGVVHEADFRRLGFSADQIRAYADEAWRRALAQKPGLAARFAEGLPC